MDVRRATVEPLHAGPAVAPRTRATRFAGRRKRILLAVWIAAVATLSLIGAGLLSVYIRETECPNYTGGDPAALGMTVVRNSSNWTVTIIASPRALHPDTTAVEVRDSTHAVLLASTPWTALVPGAWSRYGILTRDNPPTGPLICEGDSLVVSALSYPAQSVLAVLDRGTPLGWAILF